MLQTTDVAALRRSENVDNLTKDKVYSTLKSVQALTAKSSSAKMSIPGRVLDKYFPKTMSIDDREKVILSLLEKWKREQEEI